MPNPTRKTVYMETFGCQMNELDSELVRGSLRALGYEFVDSREGADVVLYNTCSVREQAEDKVIGRVGEFKRIKQKNPDLVLGILGCMAERDGGEMLKRFPQIDLMCGPGELDKVPHLIDNAVKTGRPQTALQGNTTRRSGTLAAAEDRLELLDLSRSTAPTDHGSSAYVRITRGCNKFCTYCVVPFTRGAEVHRPPQHIIDECKRLADSGVIEITLLGQTVNHYRYDHDAETVIDGVKQAQVGPGLAAFTDDEHHLNVGRNVTTFADLLQRIHDEIPAIQRLRFVTSFPRDFGDDVMQVMAESPRICNYLHAPAQSGSDAVLKRMNRQYTVEQYLDFVDRARRWMPDVMIAGDVIVGFPGETDEDFEKTVELVRRVKFKNNFIFKYSPRPGTIAIDRFEDDVPDEVKRARNNALLAVQAEVSGAVHAEQEGREFDVLVEGLSYQQRRRENNVELGWDKPVKQMAGRTMGDLIVVFEGDESMIGQIRRVRIVGSKPLTLFGELVEQPAAV